MRKIWVVSDTHFNHTGILDPQKVGDYYRRFDSVDDMNDCMIHAWNETVKDGDIVYHLGDVCMGSVDACFPILANLKGKKRLVLGNHDNTKRLAPYFSKIVSSRMFPEFNCILSHIPIYLGDHPKFKYNVHGHIHHRASPTPRHICVCVEQTDYRPVDLEQLMFETQELH